MLKTPLLQYADHDIITVALGSAASASFGDVRRLSPYYPAKGLHPAQLGREGAAYWPDKHHLLSCYHTVSVPEVIVPVEACHSAPWPWSVRMT